MYPALLCFAREYYFPMVVPLLAMLSLVASSLRSWISKNKSSQVGTAEKMGGVTSGCAKPHLLEGS